MARFKVGDIVEDIGKGDLPYIVDAIERDETPPIPSRYTIECIDGSRISNFPEYLLVPARPASQSKYGQK